MSFADELARCKPWIEDALVHCGGTHTIEDIEAEISAGALQFWPGKNCAGVTRFVETPQLKILAIFLTGGDLDEILTGLEPAFVDWAKASGCSRIVETGRRGWEKVLGPRGYQVTGITMMKVI